MPTVAQVLASRPADQEQPVRALLATVTTATGPSATVTLHPGSALLEVIVPTGVAQPKTGALVLVLLTAAVNVLIAEIPS